MEVLRWGIEADDSLPECLISVLITAGMDTKFAFDRETGIFSVEGPMFDRQARLREVNDRPNGFLFCEEMYNVWNSLRLGGQWESLADGKGYRIVLMDEVGEEFDDDDLEFDAD
jgi:hypothetical protein